MNESLKQKITAINCQITEFAATWADLLCKQLQATIPREQLNNILAPGMDLIDRGGKRWRPLLMLLCCEMAGGGDKALAYTPLVEIAHNGTLIADDIEDNSPVRRGKPAIHLKFGLDMALNTANFMCFLPSLLIDQGELSPQIKGLMYKCYLEDLRNLHIGQGLDIQWHNNHRYIPSPEDYLLMCSLKTGTLARMAARQGILIAGGSEELALATGKICETFGVGFQIIDDVKNLTTGNPGKKPGDDIIEGKKSLPIILLSRENPQATTRIMQIFEGISTSPEPEQDALITEAINLLKASGCIQAAHNRATRMIAEAREKLLTAFPASQARYELNELFNTLQ